MPSSGPNFSPFPFDRLRRTSRREAALESAIARWVAARPLGAKVAELVGGPVRAQVVAVRSTPVLAAEGATRVRTDRDGIDPHAALAEVRIGGLSIVLAASAAPIRALAQRLFGGPAELAAPRPLTTVEHAIWALAIAAALEDTGVAGEVWPLADPPAGDRLAIELAVELPAGPLTVVALCPPELVVRVPPARAVPAWTFDVPIVVGRCAIDRAALAALAVRDAITIEAVGAALPGRRTLELAIGAGAVGITAAPGDVDAKVVTGYVARDMALPDDAHLELTVRLGTTRLSLRQLAELAPGQIVPMGRPLAGPYEVHAGGRLIGRGELVDVDGELGVRILSIEE